MHGQQGIDQTRFPHIRPPQERDLRHVIPRPVLLRKHTLQEFCGSNFHFVREIVFVWAA